MVATLIDLFAHNRQFSPAVKSQPWGQSSNKAPSVHRHVPITEVVIPEAAPQYSPAPRGLAQRNCLMEKAKIRLSTETASLY
jgi:hypothetical protein